MSKNNYLTIAGIVIVVAVIAIFAWFWLGRTKPLTLSLVEAKNGDITEKVNLTGQVKASQGVDLAFEGSGKIVANYVKTGDKIYAGQALLATDSSILQAQLQQAQAQLDALNINTVESKTNVSLQSAYASGLASAQKSVSLAKDALLSVFDIEQVSADTSLWDAKGKPVESLFGQGNAGFWQTYQIARLTGGALGLVQTAVNNPTPANIDAALAATQKALQDLSYFINIIQVEDLSALNRALTIQQKNAINQEIITTSANIQTIASLKVNNTATLTTTNAQIEAAEASVNMIKAQLAKTVIRALFNGQVDKDNAIVGQIASPGTPVITISNSNLEIDTNVPEIDVANVKIGQDANITLDAFGTDVAFPATVISVDTATTMVNGISVYGAKLKFKDFDSRVKTGMTANINIISDTHTNILLVPATAIIQQNGKYFVIIDNGTQKQSKEVSVGLRDSKNIEITSGLTAGEKVLAY